MRVWESAIKACKRPVVVLAVVVCVSIIAYSCSNDDSQLEEAKARAELIIVALERYKSEDSSYPDSLDLNQAYHETFFSS